MKTLLALLMLVAAGAVQAQTTIDLPSPLVFDYAPANHNCTYNPPAWTGATGFSADGNYVTGVSSGWLACGHSGRGSNLIYTRYCFADTWDLSGNLVSVVVISGTSSCYPAPQYPASVTNAAGYEAYTHTDLYYGYIQDRYAVLVTP